MVLIAANSMVSDAAPAAASFDSNSSIFSDVDEEAAPFLFTVSASASNAAMTDATMRFLPPIFLTSLSNVRSSARTTASCSLAI